MLAVAGLAVVAASIVALGEATSPGKRPDRVHAQGRADHWQVWVASGRLTHPKKLTSGAADSGWAVGHRTEDARVRQQPDRSDPNDAEVVNECSPMRPDGTNVTKLTDSKGLSGEPAWSPDGARSPWRPTAVTQTTSRASTS